MSNNDPIAETYPHHYKLIELMCEVIDVDPNTVDLTEYKWYCNHTWSESEYREWLEKTTKYLKSNQEARYKLMQKPCNREEKIKKTLGIENLGWSWNYGWKMDENWEVHDNG